MSSHDDRLKYVWAPIAVVGMIIIAVSPLVLLNSAPRDENGKVVPISTHEEVSVSDDPNEDHIAEVNTTPVSGIITDKYTNSAGDKYYLTIDDTLSNMLQKREVSKSVYLTVQIGLNFTIIDAP